MKDFPDELDQEDMDLFMREWKLSGGRKMEYTAFGIVELFEDENLVAVYAQKFERDAHWTVTRVLWKKSPQLLEMIIGTLLHADR